MSIPAIACRKGRNICLIMRQAKSKTPKFYVLEPAHDHPVTHQTEMLSGLHAERYRGRSFFVPRFMPSAFQTARMLNAIFSVVRKSCPPFCKSLKLWRSGTLSRRCHALRRSRAQKPRPALGPGLRLSGVDRSRRLLAAGPCRGALGSDWSRRRRKSSIWSVNCCRSLSCSASNAAKRSRKW